MVTACGRYLKVMEEVLGAPSTTLSKDTCAAEREIPCVGDAAASTSMLGRMRTVLSALAAPATTSRLAAYLAAAELTLHHPRVNDLAAALDMAVSSV